jgi:hypothetical protein
MHKLLDVLFGCSHRRLTFPMTARKGTSRTRSTYIVCLECGKEFAYDWSLMKVIFKQDKAPYPVAEPVSAGSPAA